MILGQNNIFAGRYRLEEKLGSGGFGEVWKAFDNVTGQYFAIKIHLKGDGERAAQEIVKEYTRVMHIHHDNLLTPSHVDIADGNVPYLVMELCEYDLTDRDLTETEVWQLIRDVSAGLKRLSENKRKRTRSDGTVAEVSDPIIHQDIKPANILLRSNGMYAISDFGISKRRLSSLSTNDATQTQDVDSAMSIDYAAPERFPKEKGVAVLASDIWSLGATLFEVVEGRRPFAECGGDCLNPTIGLKIPVIEREGYSNELKELIYDCMAKSPEDRPSADQLHGYSIRVLTNKQRIKSWPSASTSKKDSTSKEHGISNAIKEKPKSNIKSFRYNKVPKNEIKSNQPIKNDKTEPRHSETIKKTLGAIVLIVCIGFYCWYGINVIQNKFKNREKQEKIRNKTLTRQTVEGIYYNPEMRETQTERFYTGSDGKMHLAKQIYRRKNGTCYTYNTEGFIINIEDVRDTLL